MRDNAGMPLRIAAVAASLGLSGLLLVAPTQANTPAAATDGAAAAQKPAFRRIGLTPPSCDDSRRVVVKTMTDDAAVRHEQSVHWIRHNFKGYQMKPKCAVIQVREATPVPLERHWRLKP
ncbi:MULTISPECIES: hypothetical protein [Hansschlegelia]|uniref:Uncharacterized protein n=1 Tax=Hansschlegelia zhihuaiae TaxID=405005 RepID=A0A4Q0MDM7_9HYPH|nr:hypothetical protein [Hansschlegelia zhihuaiae]RXF71507.1 hypothetical protein EK403_15700 [Hansschlegelia zhihuaiae]